MTIFALMLSAAAASAYPASATIAGRLPPSPPALPSINPTATRELKGIRSEVRVGRERGELSRKQSKELRREAREIAMLEQRYSAGGLSEAEHEELRARVEMVKALARAKRSGLLK